MADAEAPVAAAAGATKNKILFSFFWSIFSLVTTIQCDVDLFSAACGGDAGMTARSLAAVSGFMGVLGLFVNQIGGKLSDSIGRKPLFPGTDHVNQLATILDVLGTPHVDRSTSAQRRWASLRAEVSEEEILARCEPGRLRHPDHDSRGGAARARGEGPPPLNRRQQA